MCAWHLHIRHAGRYRNHSIPGQVYLRGKDVQEFAIYSISYLTSILSLYVRDSQGPYISEDAIGTDGKVLDGVRTKNHWGVFTCPDGKVYEGNLVDNHFDPDNVQGVYRLTFPHGDVYEGEFMDERLHGIGIYRWVDGSVYDGEWHCNRRYGHGRLQSSEQWVYEGQFENDTRNGEGMITYSDGSVYIGEWQLDKYQGKGIFVSRLHDVYTGMFSENKFHGYGEILYNNGSQYMGEFLNGIRHGKGVFKDRLGVEYFGEFVNDLKHGQVIVKEKVLVAQQPPVLDTPAADLSDFIDDHDIKPEFEIKTAEYNMGTFVCWTGHINNPLATAEFVRMFEKDKRMFTGVYSLLLAKYLPKLPPGIDANHPQVARILRQIRADGGLLVGVDAKARAQERISVLLPMLKEQKELVDKLKRDIEWGDKELIKKRIELTHILRKYRNLMEQIDRESAALEMFWIDERSGSRARFLQAVSNLSIPTREEWFKFKNHRNPPPFLKKVMDSVSYCLNLSLEWHDQQMLCSDSLYNRHNGDEEALRFEYDCKLVHIMKTYDIYEYSTLDEERDRQLDIILADTRFRRDSYYVESLGEPGPYVVDLVKTNYAFMRAALSKREAKRKIDEDSAEAVRIKLNHTRKTDEIDRLANQLEDSRNEYSDQLQELEKMQREFNELSGVLQFIDESESLGRKHEDDMDYYELMERRLEEKQDRLDVEACLESVLIRLQAKKDLQLQTDAALLGVPHLDEVYDRLDLIQYIEQAVGDTQVDCSKNGLALGFSLNTEANTISKETTADLVQKVVTSTIKNINTHLREDETTRTWVMLKGRRIQCRFVYVMVWENWKAQGIRRAEDEAVQGWENIFGDPDECARMAVQSRVNWRMSDIAREQAKVWMKRHPREVELAEFTIAREFEDDYSEDTANVAIQSAEDESGAVPPAMKCASLCWMALNPAAVAEARHIINNDKALEFAEFFGQESALKAFKIINGLSEQEELGWADYALQWKAFHEEEYNAEEEKQITIMSNVFVTLHPKDTHIAAAKIIEEEVLSRLVKDDELARGLWSGIDAYSMAKSWGIRNQGLLKTATRIVREEHDSSAAAQWKDLSHQTEQFTRGSYLLLPESAREDPSQDRFVGFRNRLRRKFAWLRGYLQKHQADMASALNDLMLSDPSLKLQHNVRPSEAEELRISEEKAFKKAKRQAEEAYAETMEKISTWNSYFGPMSDEAVFMEAEDVDP